MSARFVQSGISLVELLVGLAIGLIVIATALYAVTQHLRENKRLLVEARLMQDLRTAAELIARDLRRAGHIAVTPTGVAFSYANLPATQPQLAYQLRNGVIEMRIGEGAWQAMTDRQIMQVTALDMTPNIQETDLSGLCTAPCAADDDNCPPRQLRRSVSIRIEAILPGEASLVRDIRSTVRLRHDAIIGACPA